MLEILYVNLYKVPLLKKMNKKKAELPYTGGAAGAFLPGAAGGV